jgi:hypothetical protein
MISITSTVVATQNQISTDMSNETVILDLDSGVYYGLDPVGSFIWKHLQEPRAVTAIRDAVLDKYDVDQARCETDLLALLQKLQAQGLIEVKG